MDERELQLERKVASQGTLLKVIMGLGAAVILGGIVGGGFLKGWIDATNDATETAEAAKATASEALQFADEASKIVERMEGLVGEAEAARDAARAHSEQADTTRAKAGQAAAHAREQLQLAKRHAEGLARLTSQAKRMLEEKGGVPIVGPTGPPGPKGDPAKVDYNKVNHVVRGLVSEAVKAQKAGPYKPTDVFKVTVSGAYNTIWIRSGSPARSEITHAGSNGARTILVPESHPILLRVTGYYNTFNVPKSLVSRIDIAEENTGNRFIWEK